MEARELIQRYDAMHLEDGMLRKAFVMLANASTKSAMQFLEFVEGVTSYDNYISESEAIEIVNRFKNADGTEGAKWSPDTLFAKVAALGGDVDHAPKYNKWALYVTMNMEHSDHYPVLQKWTGSDATKYAEACYDLAVSQLKDKDRHDWIRRYFQL